MPASAQSVTGQPARSIEERPTVPELSDWRTPADLAAEAFEQLVVDRQRELHRLAYAITADHALATRAVDRTLHAAWTRMAGGTPPVELRLWLLSTTAEESHRERRQRQIERLIAAWRWLDPRGWARREGTNAEDDDPQLAAVLAGVPEEDRRILTLRYASGLTSDEIAGQLRLTAPGIRRHLADLRDRVRQALGLSIEPEGANEVEIDQAIARRLVTHLDRGAPSVDPRSLARGISSGTAHRPGRIHRGLLVAGAGAAVLVAAGIGLLAGQMRPAAQTTPLATPAVGTLVPLAAWKPRQVAETGGNYRILSWAPDSRRVAVQHESTGQLEIRDAAGALIRSLGARDGAWADSEHLAVLEPAQFSFASSVRIVSLGSDPDLVVPGVEATQLVGGGGLAAFNPEAVDDNGIPAPTFSVLVSGTLSKAHPGVPLAWTRDGSALLYLSDATGTCCAFRGTLHLLRLPSLTDTDLKVRVVQSEVTSLAPDGERLLACILPPADFGCRLGLVNLRTGATDVSSLPDASALSAWTDDGQLIMVSGDTIFRWTAGDEPVATRWQPERRARVQLAIGAGKQVVVSVTNGPAVLSEVAGEVPRLIVLPNSELASSAAVSPDRRHLLYAQSDTAGTNRLMLVDLPRPGASTSPDPSTSAAPLSGLAVRPPPEGIESAQIAQSEEGSSWMPVAGAGLHLYLQLDSEDSSSFQVMDVASGTATPFESPARSGERVDSVISNGKWIAMLLVAPAFACDAEPRAWRIVLASTNASGLPSGPFRTFVSGQSTRLYAGEGVGGCWSQFPHMAIDSGNIAYDIETPTEANPWGSRIVLRRLADGTPIRSITTRDPVFSLTVSGTNLVWTEAPRGRAQLTWSIWTSTAAHPEKSLVIEGTAATGGASLPSPVLSNGTVVYGGGRIVAISPGSHTARTISPEGWPCDLLAARRNVVLMTCGGQPSRTVIWKADTGPVVIDGLGEVGTAFLSDDWLLVRGNAEPDVDEIRAIPAASLYGK